MTDAIRQLQVQGLSRHIGDEAVLSDLTFTLAGGKATALVSADRNAVRELIHCLKGITDGFSGTLTFDDRRPGRGERVRRVAVTRREVDLFEGRSLRDELNLSYDLQHPHRLLPIPGSGRARYQARVLEILAALGYVPDGGRAQILRTPHERALLELARVCALDAAVYVFDEALESLNTAQHTAFAAILERLKDEGRCVLLITRQSESINPFADEVLLLRGGRLVRLRQTRDFDAERVDFLTSPSEHAQLTAVQRRFDRHIESRAHEEILDRELIDLLHAVFMVEDLTLAVLAPQKLRIFYYGERIPGDRLEARIRQAVAAPGAGGESSSTDVDGGWGVHLRRREGKTHLAFLAPAGELAEATRDPRFARIWGSYLHAFQTIELARKEEVDKKDVALAGFFQQSLLVSDFSVFSVDLHGVSIPAKTLGGDFFEILQLDENRVFVFLADVSGKGVAAGICMMMIKSILQGLSEARLGPADLFTKVNRALFRQLKGEKYATACGFVYDRSQGSLEYVNAGHCDILLVAPDGSVRRLSAGGIPIGISEDTPFSAETVDVAAGELAVLYTDGVTEARDRREQEYGLDRLEKLLGEHRGEGAQAITDLILAEVRAFSRDTEQHDDITMVVMKA